ncbi:hypothetical protein LINGRAHAP2_LOCUS10940 [Linum grandiflorum]
MQLVMGSVVPMTLQAANELRIFSVLAAEDAGVKLSASEIVSRLDFSSTTMNSDAWSWLIGFLGYWAVNLLWIAL